MPFEFKVYLKDGREYFEYGIKDREITKKNFEFSQSLLDLLYFDIWSYGDLFDEMRKAVQALYPPAGERMDEQKNIAFLRESFDTLAKQHLYFELLRLEWNEKLDKYEGEDYSSRTTLLPHKKISHIPSNIQAMQEQIKKLFEQVLDVVLADKNLTVQQRMARYYARSTPNSTDIFQFETQKTNFERVDTDTFAEVLYPENIYDIIDFSLRNCIKQELSMRVCKSCGKYFAVTGYANSEYCNREFKDSGKTCKEVGAVRLLQNKLSTDPVHKAYSKAYKTRFARIKYRKISKEEFAAWSELAREMRDKTLAGDISLEELECWLKD